MAFYKNNSGTQHLPTKGASNPAPTQQHQRDIAPMDEVAKFMDKLMEGLK